MKQNPKQRLRGWAVFLSLIITVSMTFGMTAYAKTKGNDFVSRYVTVNEKQMHVVLYGEVNETGQEFADQNKATLVMLPALGVMSPHIYFKPLAEALEERFNIVIVEPLGYGLSDVTAVDRTVENINEELDKALEELNIDRCIFARTFYFGRIWAELCFGVFRQGGRIYCHRQYLSLIHI